ncbi:MAG: class I SAM-dependent methyltransferase [Phycisphaerales bacterium]
MERVSEAAAGARVVPTREGYDLWASCYDGDANPLVILEEGHVMAALGEPGGVAGLRVADVGCGTGRHAARLARAGARVTAVDFSMEMLARAREKPGAEGVRFVEHDLRRPLPLGDASFDRVLCCLVLDHIADLGLLFGELGRICTCDGFVLVTVMHPAMMLKGVQARFTAPGSPEKVRVESVANQISDYVMAAVRAGLTIEAMREHAADDALAHRAPRAAKYLGWPMLLVMKLRRV